MILVGRPPFEQADPEKDTFYKMLQEAETNSQTERVEDASNDILDFWTIWENEWAS